jgi:cyanate lyase
MPTQEDPIIIRRRSRFFRALIATGATLVLAVAIGGWLWAALAVVAGGTGCYVAILRHLKLQNDEARRVVRELDLTREEVAATPRVAVGGGGQEFEHSSVRLRRWDT